MVPKPRWRVRRVGGRNWIGAQDELRGNGCELVVRRGLRGMVSQTQGDVSVGLEGLPALQIRSGRGITGLH